jgi:transcriptional regulator with XRE-family HTH domain
MSALSGPAIQTVREQLGLSVEQFAAALGVHKSSVYRWEATRRRRPHLRPQVQQVLQALVTCDVPALRSLGAQIKQVPSNDPMAAMRVLFSATAMVAPPVLAAAGDTADAVSPAAPV